MTWHRLSQLVQLRRTRCAPPSLQWRRRFAGENTAITATAHTSASRRSNLPSTSAAESTRDHNASSPGGATGKGKGMRPHDTRGEV